MTLSKEMQTKPASKKLLRLVSARCDINAALEAYSHFVSHAGSPVAEHFFFAMVVAYGRPFTDNYKLGSIKCDYPSYPDYAEDEMNQRHKRLIDIRNKFLAHSSVEGTRIIVIPPNVSNPVTGQSSQEFDHNIGKRLFLDPEYSEWLVSVILAFQSRLDVDVRDQLIVEYGGDSPSEIFELETGWTDFKWNQKKDNNKGCCGG